MASFVKDVLSVGISKFLIIGFTIGSSIITARWLGPEGSGVLASLMVYPSLFLTFGALGISQSTTYIIGSSEYSEQEVKTTVFQLWMATSILSVFFCYLLIRYFSNSGGNIFWTLLAILPIPFTLFNKYSSGIFLGKNEITTYNKINWLPKAISFASVFIFVVIFSFHIPGALVALCVGPFILFAVLILRLKIKVFNLKINVPLAKKMFSLGVIYALALLVINLNYKIDIVLLDKMSSPFNTGIYAKGASFLNFLWEIPMVISTIIFARSANAKDGFGFSLKVAQLLRISFVAITIAAAILIIFAKQIILVMYGEDFIESTTVMQFLLPGILLLTIFKVLNMDLAGKGKPWISLKAMSPALVVNIALNVILIPRWGANGAALASTISYTLGALVFLFLYCKETHIPIVTVVRFTRADFSQLLSVIKRKNSG